MKLLLDTHALIWIFDSPETLSVDARRELQSGEHDVVCSVLSLWQLAIKQSIGKLRLPDSVDRWLPPLLEAAGIGTVAIAPQHAYAVRHLPHHHRDPFDRMLIAQAQSERMTIVTRDRIFERYDVGVMLA